MKIFILMLVVVFAKTVETVTGFGGSVFVIALGSMLFPIKEIIVAVVLIALLQSLWMVGRNYRNIRWRILLTRILPLTGIGLPIGRWIFSHYEASQLKIVLGVFVVFISVMELINLYRNRGQVRPLPWPLAIAFLFAGGVVHGMFGTGGPLIVYYACRQLPDKDGFRATIPTLWVILNGALMASYGFSGAITTENLGLAGMLVPAVALGILAGEIIHTRVNEFVFKIVVQVVLLLTGIIFLLHG